MSVSFERHPGEAALLPFARVFGADRIWDGSSLWGQSWRRAGAETPAPKSSSSPASKSRSVIVCDEAQRLLESQRVGGPCYGIGRKHLGPELVEPVVEEENSHHRTAAVVLGNAQLAAELPVD